MTIVDQIYRDDKTNLENVLIIMILDKNNIEMLHALIHWVFAKFKIFDCYNSINYVGSFLPLVFSIVLNI